MSYLSEKVLTSSEIIKIEPKKNRIFLILKWIWGVLGFWLLLIPTIKAIMATVEFCSTEYLVTDKRVLEKYGLVSTHTDDMPLIKIENVTVDYTFFGKIFNYGNIYVQGANRNNVVFTCIKDAEQVKRKIYEILG